ncbi:siderophore-interacting protein [Mumia zhuanghuii]|nr:siderophore-interacting protein [Mumia zhuanghuii]
MRVFHAEVVRTEDVSPALRRIVFGGPGLAGFRSTGVGDEYLRILFPAAGETAPVLPEVVDGNLDYASIDLTRLRTYTVRDVDEERGEVTIEFVVHEGGVAAAWAQQAKPGDVVGLNSPTGLYDPPSALDWQMLVADCAALPAAARILAETPDHVRTRVVVEVADPAHRIPLPERPGIDVTWVTGGNGHGPSRLAEVVRTLPRPEGVGYTWVAGEARALRDVRRHLRKDLGLPASAYKTVGYWTADADRWHEQFEALPADVRAELDALWDSDRDPEDIEDEWDDRLTRLGL